MATLNENIYRIEKAKINIKNAIEAKGVTVGDGLIDTYAKAIDSIPQEGSAGPNWGLAYYPLEYYGILNGVVERHLNDTLEARNHFVNNYGGQENCNWALQQRPIVYAPFLNTAAATSMAGFFSQDAFLDYVPDYDTRNCIDFSEIFTYCTDLKYAPTFNTDNAHSVGWFYTACYNLEEPQNFNLPNVTDMRSMFNSCRKMSKCPAFTFNGNKNVKTVGGMFAGCRSLVENQNLIDLLTDPDFLPTVTDCSQMFQDCWDLNLTNVKLLETSNCTNFYEMFANCTTTTTLPEIDMSNATNILFFIADASNPDNLLPSFTTMGGFKGLKIDADITFGVALCPNLTKESVLNIINDLYDFRANGDAETTKTFKFHADSLALLTPEEIAIATAKGWILSDPSGNQPTGPDIENPDFGDGDF